MAITRIQWTAVPAGVLRRNRNTANLRVAALASFRLEPDGGAGTVADFPTVGRWPDVEVALTVHLARGGTEVSSPGVPVDPQVRHLAWWQAAIRPELGVRAFDHADIVDRASWRVRSYPAEQLAAHVEELHVAAARLGAPDDDAGEPRVDDGPLQGFAALGTFDRTLVETDQGILGTIEAQLAGQGYAEPANVRSAVVQLRRFYDRRTDPDPPDAGPAPGRPGRISWLEAPELEVHQVIGALSRHLSLLRPLGLARDVLTATPLDQLNRRLGGPPELVWVTAEVTAADGDDVRTEPSPRTRCLVLPDDRFVARPRSDGDLDLDGWVRLDQPHFSVRTFDADTAGSFAVALGTDLQVGAFRRSRTTPTEAGPANLRSAGIAVLRTLRAKQFRQQILERSAELTKGVLAARGPDDGGAGEAPPELWLDDLVRGYRIDVLDGRGGGWRSLCRRRGTVDLGAGIVVDVADEEGAIELVPVADDEPGQVYLHEEVVRWDGWSLSAPKPGRAVGPEDQVDAFVGDERPPGTPWDVTARYEAVPGSLPTLRYGVPYELRARVVDAAGGGLDLGAGAGQRLPVVRAMAERWEPVPSPAVLQAQPRRPAETDRRVVLRSPRWDAGTDDVSIRHVQPPRITIGDAERHGVLDRPDGTPDPARYAELAALDGAGYEAFGAPDPSNDLLAAVGDGEISRYYGEDPLAVAGPPDPMARRLLLGDRRGLSLLVDEEGHPVLPPFEAGLWPQALGVRLIVAEGPSVQVSWDPNARAIRVALPKAEVLPVRVASVPDKDDLGRFGLVRRLEATGAPAWVLDRVVAGRHWALTPNHRLTLVHAVKQPLLAPRNQGLGYGRAVGETAARLSGNVGISLRSTGPLDIVGTWQEGIDEGPDPERPPRIESETAVVYRIPTDEALGQVDGYDELRHGGTHQLGDTKARRITYDLVATTAFLDHFTERRLLTIAGEITEVDPAGLEPTTVVVRGLPDDGGPRLTYERGDRDGEGDFVVDGTAIRRTRTEEVDGRPPLLDGQTVEVAYATPAISRTAAEHGHASNGGPVELAVGCSARPAVPSIRQILPTFRWSRSGTATVTSQRIAAGVRVYLDRPWWSSGLGEQLAVLIWPGTNLPPASQAPFVTRWGRDPIHAVGQVEGVMGQSAFPLALGITGILSVPGALFPVIALPHAVDYAPDRDLWFCDIDLSIASSWPFVRLALARHQPLAIRTNANDAASSLSLSPVVLADMVQLAPGRTATVTRAGLVSGLVILPVTLSGPSHATTSQDPVAPKVFVTVERRDPALVEELGELDEDLGWVRVTGPIELGTRDGTNANQPYTWSGSVRTPPSTERTRLVVEEREIYRTDDFPGEGHGLDPQYDGPGRLVHLDVIEITHLVGP